MPQVYSSNNGTTDACAVAFTSSFANDDILFQELVQLVVFWRNDRTASVYDTKPQMVQL